MNDNWILPEERLPESDNRCRLYIVTIIVPALPGQRSRWVTTARYYLDNWVQTNENGSHYLEIGGVKVVAWQPFPGPYMGGNE